MHVEDPYCTPGLRFYQTLLEKDRHARLDNQDRLRQLRASQGNQIDIFCSHDVKEFERLTGHPAKLPAALEDRYFT